MRNRQPFGSDWYVLSNTSGLNLSAGFMNFGGPTDSAFSPGGLSGLPNSGSDLSGDGDGGGQVRQLDYGAVYASKSFNLEDGRRVWFGWVYEVRIS